MLRRVVLLPLLFLPPLALADAPANPKPADKKAGER
jgi:hypothetical protein